MSNREEQNTIGKQLLQLIKQEHPESVQGLIDLAKNRLSISGGDARKRVLELANEGKISLTKPLNPKTPSTYMLSREAHWFWTIITLAFATTVTVFTVPEDAYPLVYIRYVLGTIFILWLPGYAFIRALFPMQVPIETSSTSLDQIERTALSLGMSIALVPIVGLLLNYTPWGIRLTPITLGLLALTVVFALAALLRDFQNKTNKFKTQD